MRIKTAQRFGEYLDADDFEKALKLLSDDCIYEIGEKVLNGPKMIIQSYEENMIEGRKKLDELIWGKSSVEQLDAAVFLVCFTDYLVHKGEKHTHRCKQLLQIIQECQIIEIKHIPNPVEEAKLRDYYLKVGLGGTVLE